MEKFHGILLIKSIIATRILGITISASSFIWFFFVTNRNINDYEGGLDANQQALLFFLGTLSAFALTFIISSIVNARMNNKEIDTEQGLGNLKHTNYLLAVKKNIRSWQKNGLPR
tara:strand:+ start:435 stop:779 length:345 start_codon:yes stop_codon:yes gene_type:complete